MEKLKKKHGNSELVVRDMQDLSNQEINYLEVSEANAELVRTGAKLSLEDMESENFTLLDENVEYSANKDLATNSTNLPILETNLDQLIDSIPTIDKNVPSPSDILKNLCLSKEEEFTEILQEQNGEKNYDLFDVLM